MIIAHVGLTLVVALLSGAVFWGLRVPLPWMLGPLAGVIIWRNVLAGQPCWPVVIRNGGLIILGYMMGRSFTPEAAGQIASQYPAMLLVTALTIGFSLLVSYMTCRQTGESLASCIIGGVPGGLTQMTVLGEEIPKADGTIVTFMQTIRMLGVIFCVPFLAVHGLASSPAGWSGAVSAAGANVSYDIILLLGAVLIAGTWLAVRLKLPTAYLIGPVIGISACSLYGCPAPAVPQTAIIAAQLAIGTYLGSNVRLGKLGAAWRQVLPVTLLNVALVIVFSFCLGWLLSRFTGVSPVTGFLSTAPGGMAEMGLTALMVNADLSTVVAYQLFRVLVILLILPLFLKRWLC